MTDQPREPPPPSRSDPWWSAVRGGAISFAYVALGALAIGVAEWLAAGRPFGLRLPWKLAGLYVGAFHGAGVRAMGSGALGPGVGVTSFMDVTTETTLHVTFLLGTALVLFVAGVAGRRVADRTGGGWGRRIAWGSAVAPTYALLVFVVSLVVVLRFPAAGIADVRVVAWEVLVRSFVVAAMAGGAGGFLSARAAIESPSPWVARAVAWVVGGWRMTVALLVLAFAGFLVVAGVQTDASTAYARVATGSATGAILTGHHLLLLPNQSFLIAVPAMGGCVELDGATSQPTTLCVRDLTVRPGWPDLLFPSAPRDRDIRLSPVWLLFLLVPGSATVWGGRAAGMGTASARERAVRGAGAGLVFAALFAAGVAVSALSVTRSGGELFGLGADVGRTAALALAWGVIGGVAGAVLLVRPQTGGPAPLAGPDAEPEPEEPPSPTSV